MSDTTAHDQSHQASSTRQAADEAKTLKDEALAKAGSVRDAAIDAARDTAESAKAGVADEISTVGDALRRASDDLRDGSPQERTFGQMASTLADLSDTVRDKDMGEMVDDLSGFARRNPVAFLGAAALVGFAGVRMAKASQRKRDDGGYDDAGYDIDGYGAGRPDASAHRAAMPARAHTGDTIRPTATRHTGG